MRTRTGQYVMRTRARQQVMKTRAGQHERRTRAIKWRVMYGTPDTYNLLALHYSRGFAAVQLPSLVLNHKLAGGSILG